MPALGSLSAIAFTGSVCLATRHLAHPSLADLLRQRVAAGNDSGGGSVPGSIAPRPVTLGRGSLGASVCRLGRRRRVRRAASCSVCAAQHCFHGGTKSRVSGAASFVKKSRPSPDDRSSSAPVRTRIGQSWRAFLRQVAAHPDNAVQVESLAAVWNSQQDGRKYRRENASVGWLQLPAHCSSRFSSRVTCQIPAPPPPSPGRQFTSTGSTAPLLALHFPDRVTVRSPLRARAISGAAVPRARSFRTALPGT